MDLHLNGSGMFSTELWAKRNFAPLVAKESLNLSRLYLAASE